jgi:molybdopterin converting factor small subunit
VSTVSVYIPTPFRRVTEQQPRVEAEADTLGELVANLERRYPGFEGLIYDDKGEFVHHLNVYINNRDVASLDGKSTQLQEGDEVAFIPAIAGG